jgi:hypothetical protein
LEGNCLPEIRRNAGKVLPATTDCLNSNYADRAAFVELCAAGRSFRSRPN